MIPEFAESMVLGFATIWMFHLYKRTRVIALVFSGIYLAFPAVVLLMQALGGSPLSITTTKCIAVSVDFALTVMFVRMTWDQKSQAPKIIALAQDIQQEQVDCTVRAAEHADMARSLADSNAERVRHLLAEVAHG